MPKIQAPAIAENTDTNNCRKYRHNQLPKIQAQATAEKIKVQEIAQKIKAQEIAQKIKVQEIAQKIKVQEIAEKAMHKSAEITKNISNIY